MQTPRFRMMCTYAMMAMMAVFASLTMTACHSAGTGGSKEGATTMESLVQLRANLLQTKTQVQENIDAANALPNSGGNLNEALINFQLENEETRHAADAASKRSASFRVNAAKHINNWEAEMNNLSDPQLRAAGTERAEVVRKHFDDIRSKAADAKGAYTPFMNHLTDLDVYLQQDTTMRGVNAAKPILGQINDSGKALLKSIDAFIASLDALTADAANVNTVNGH